jgi:hypothetical protein
MARYKELSGGEAETTNNRMELMAAISALNALKEPVQVDLYTDSKYVMDGISKWIHGWKKNGWKTADKKPVKNAELWQALDEASRRHKVARGIGSRAMPGIRRTSAPMNWRASQWNRSRSKDRASPSISFPIAPACAQRPNRLPCRANPRY